MADQVLEPAAFYVYVHTRNDTNAVFYVGKGRGKRFRTKRHHNSYWMRIAEKHGFSAKIVALGMSEVCAFSLERALISALKSKGVQLANLTDGGEGPSGRVFSAETLERMKVAKSGRPLSVDHRQKISDAHRGKSHSEEHKAALRNREFSKEHREALRLAALQRRQSDETKRKIASLKTGTKASSETRAKMAAQRGGKGNVNFSPEMHVFAHPDHGEIECTQYELRTKFGLPHSNLSRLVKGIRGAVHGWRIVKPGG